MKHNPSKQRTPALGVALFVLGAVLVSGRAHAAPVATAECLAASSASFKFDNQHRLRAERAELLVCASPGCPVEVRKECLRRVDEVNAAIPTIIFEAKDKSGNDLGGVRVTMDSELLSERLEGLAIAIDPGSHVFTFEAAGHPPERKDFVIRQGQKNRVERVTFGPVLGVANATVAPPSPPQTVSGVAGAAAPPDSSPDGRSGTSALAGRRTLLIAAVGVAAVGFGLGTVFGLQALSKRDEAQKTCPTTLCSDQSAVNSWQDAKQAGNLSTGAFVVGGIGLGVAAALWLTARTESDQTPAAKAQTDARARAHAEVQVAPGLVAMGWGGVW